MAIFLYSFEKPYVVKNPRDFNVDMALLFFRHGQEEILAGHVRDITPHPRPPDRKVLVRALVKTIDGRDVTIGRLQLVEFTTEHGGRVESLGSHEETDRVTEEKFVDETRPDAAVFEVRRSGEVVAHHILRCVWGNRENPDSGNIPYTEFRFPEMPEGQ